MTYLILHKVRGEAAFDIADRFACPECAAEGCDECDGNGNWWIIPTSGHRAYPINHWLLDDLCDISDYPHVKPFDCLDKALPPSWPDHYPCNKSPEDRSIVQRIVSSFFQARPVKIDRRF